jgi:hypothetical protein
MVDDEAGCDDDDGRTDGVEDDDDGSASDLSYITDTEDSAWDAERARVATQSLYIERMLSAASPRATRSSPRSEASIGLSNLNVDEQPDVTATER